MLLFCEFSLTSPPCTRLLPRMSSVVPPDVPLATEALIVCSQSMFFTVLFFLLKRTLVDNYGLMDNPQRIRDHALPLVAIFISILGTLGVLMIPLQYYSYPRPVLIIVLSSISVIMGLDIWRLRTGRPVSLTCGLPFAGGVDASGKSFLPTYPISSSLLAGGATARF
jgi:hypothetical protein